MRKETTYDIISNGEIYSSYKNGLLVPRLRKDGYLDISLGGKSYLVHRLVTGAFLGESELEVNHKDGDKKNNKIENLEYVTRSENIRHSIYRLGNTHAKKGDENSNSKIKNEDSASLLNDYLMGFDKRCLAKKYGVSSSYIMIKLNSLDLNDEEIKKFNNEKSRRVARGRLQRWK